MTRFVYLRVSILFICMRSKWTDNEIKILVEFFSTTNNDELIELFENRTFNSIKNKAKRLKLKKSKTTEFENRSAAHWGDKNGMYGRKSVKLGKSYDEYYGEEKSEIIRNKISKKAKNHKRVVGKKNGMYGKIPHNKGISPSKEIKDKIRAGIKKYWDNLSDDELEIRLSQLRNDWIKKRNNYSEIDTVPEKITEELLNRLNIIYRKKQNIGYYNCDFVVGDNIIEVQGDYWHANPKIYTTHDNIQNKNHMRDIRKLTYLKNKGYSVLYLWEYDLKNNIDFCESKIKNICNDCII